jgi:hypothetical protein
MGWDLYGDDSFYALLLLDRKPKLLPCLFSYPLEARLLKTAYSRWCGPIPLLGDGLWVCSVRVRLRQQHWRMVRLRDASLRSRMPVCEKNKRWRLFWDASYCYVEFSLWFSQDACNVVLHNGHVINYVPVFVWCDVWFFLYFVMCSVRDSHWSRDYRRGTGTRVFHTENPGCYNCEMNMCLSRKNTPKWQRWSTHTTTFASAALNSQFIATIISACFGEWCLKHI